MLYVLGKPSRLKQQASKKAMDNKTKRKSFQSPSDTITQFVSSGSGTAFYTGTNQCLTLFGNHHLNKLESSPSDRASEAWFRVSERYLPMREDPECGPDAQNRPRFPISYGPQKMCELLASRISPIELSPAPQAAPGTIA
jgi:hypothetical protein